MKILVTGTAGFIGYHLAERLIADGHEVIGLDVINDYYDVNLKYARLQNMGIERSAVAYGAMVQSNTLPKYRFIQLNLTDKEGIAALFAKEQFEGVVNLAAQAGVRYSLENPFAYTDSNVTGFMTILEGCRAVKVKHLVYASTSSVYGLNTHMPLTPHESVRPSDDALRCYQKANEMMAHSYSHLFQIPTTGVRFFTVYGPWGRPDMALFLFTKAILAGEPIKVFNNGDMIRDFTYVGDIVEGLVRILHQPAQPSAAFNGLQPDPAISSAPYRVVNIGNNNPVVLKTYIEAAEKALGKKAIQELLPMQLGDVPATNADVSDLVNDYGYKPQTTVEAGVAKFIEWYMHFYGKQ